MKTVRDLMATSKPFVIDDYAYYPINTKEAYIEGFGENYTLGIQSLYFDFKLTFSKVDWFEEAALIKECRCPIISLGIVHIDSCQSILTNSSNETPIVAAMR